MKLLDKILIAFFILLVVAGIIVYGYSKKDGNMCVSDPVSFIEEKTESYCFCNCFNPEILHSSYYYGNDYNQNQPTNGYDFSLSFLNEST